MDLLADVRLLSSPLPCLPPLVPQHAPYTSLRLEVWDRDRLSFDDFIGEVMVPLCPLMDGRTHSYTLELTDPEKKCVADTGLSGSITFKLMYES